MLSLQNLDSLNKESISRGGDSSSSSSSSMFFGVLI